MTPPVARAVAWGGLHLRRHFAKAGTLIWLIGVVAVAGIIRAVGGSARSVADLMVLYVVPLGALSFGSSALREEVEDQTLTYAFSRPIDRGLLYAARVFAAVGVVCVLGVAGTLFTIDEPTKAMRYVPSALAAAAAYTTFFAMWGALLKRPAAFGIVFAIGWEQGLGSVPGFLSSLTLRAHLRGLANLRPDNPVLSGFWTAPATWVSVLVLVGVVVVTTAVGALLARQREFVLSR